MNGEGGGGVRNSVSNTMRFNLLSSRVGQWQTCMKCQDPNIKLKSSCIRRDYVLALLFLCFLSGSGGWVDYDLVYSSVWSPAYNFYADVSVAFLVLI